MSLTIHINAEPVQLLQPLPDKIDYLNITCHSHPLQPLMVPHHDAVRIKQWFNNIIDRLDTADGYVTYNGVAINQSELNKFKL